MTARLYTMPALAGEATTLWLGDLRILRTPEGWHVARPSASGGLVGVCVAMTLGAALAAARAVQGAA